LECSYFGPWSQSQHLVKKQAEAEQNPKGHEVKDEIFLKNNEYVVAV